MSHVVVLLYNKNGKILNAAQEGDLHWKTRLESAQNPQLLVPHVREFGAGQPICNGPALCVIGVN